MTNHNPLELPDDLPMPIDDGAAQHLKGKQLPDLELAATGGGTVNLARLPGRSVAYIYPRTGKPGQPLPDGWDDIPGARGCTPQSCGFRNHFNELRAAGVGHLFGLSSQDSAYQREAVERLHLPFELLSDERLEFAAALKLPTFEAGGMRLFKRMTLIVDDGAITFVFYPVFPPDKSAEETLRWLRNHMRT